MASDKLRIAGTVHDSIVDGPGIRFTIFTQGCEHNCPGCHNPQTHPLNGGKEIAVDELIAEMLKNPLLDGVTLSGGEPFLQADKLCPVARAAKHSGLTVWTYSGWTFEQLWTGEASDDCRRELLTLTDVLVDGPFILSERSLELKWCGSRNQRLIDVQNSIDRGEAVLYVPPVYGADFEIPKW